MTANPSSAREASALRSPMSPPPAPPLAPLPPAPAPGRDTRGRFAAGNKGGPGNPFARRVAALRQALLDALTPDDLKAIVWRLVEAARQGDVAAARLVLQYSVGKPAPAIDPDALDLDEWQHWQQMPVPAPLLQGLLGPLQVPLACTLARTVLPLLQDALAGQIAQQFNPTAPVPPEPTPTQPTAAGLPVAVDSTPQAAPAGAPTPRPVPVPPSAPPAATGEDVKPQRSRKPKDPADDRPAADVSALAAGFLAEGAQVPEAELARWLGLLERALFPIPGAAGGPEAPGFPCPSPLTGTG